MNKKYGNMYEWITHTHNDISGKCPYQCRYCYMLKQRWKHDPTLRLNDKALKANLGKDNTIFIGSSLDFCHPEIQTEWILKTLDHCNKYIENNLYILQTKNPERFLEQEILNHPLMQNKEQVILCTTIETNRDTTKISKAPTPTKRAEAMMQLSQMGFRTMATTEPILDFDLDEMVALLKSFNPEQVNIGCNSNPGVILPEPSKEKLVALIRELREFVPAVELKSNSKRILGDIESV